VGRDEELRSLKDQFDGVERESKPRLVTIVGPAGIGKSRLAWEFEKYLDGFVETILWHEGRSPSYGEGISYWALAEMVRQRARIAEFDEPDVVRRRIGELLVETIVDETERRWIEPRLAGLLGVDELPTESREELFAAWRTFFERLAATSTTLLVFWDLQWADQGLLDFIEHLLTWARTSPILVLAEARPELYERRPGWGAAVRSASSIRLEPLTAAQMRTLLLGLVPGLTESVLRAVVDRAEGIPLYAVETLRMLVDRGVLARDADADRFVLVAELPTLTIPETLHALIAARLDALPPDERSLVSDASVLGLTFTLTSLEAVSGLDHSALTTNLDRLIRHQVVVLELAVALGYLDQAITVTTDPQEQAVLHERAATVAMEAARIGDALAHADDAERIFASRADRLGVLRSRTVRAQIKLAEHGDVAAIPILEAALRDVADLPPGPEIAMAQSELARALMLSSDPTAIDWADKVLARPDLVSADVLVETSITRSTALLNARRFLEGEIGLRGALLAADRIGDTFAALRARNNLLGALEPVDLEATLALIREMYDIAQRFGQRTWVQQAIGSGAAIAFDAGRWDDWIPEIEEEEPMATDVYRLWFRSELAIRMAYRGQVVEALATIEEALASEAVTASVQAMATQHHVLAEIRMLEGRWDEAFEGTREGWELSEIAHSSIRLALFAAVAAGDLERLRQAVAAADRFEDKQPMSVAVRQMGDVFLALMAGRWSDARTGFIAAVGTLETTHYRRVLAGFQMAVGHLADDRFPEAAEALSEAEAFFAECGAGSVVTSYRATAARAKAVVAGGPADRPDTGARRRDVPVT
jgi:tetratricopeptide (TPR) repeat protein